MNSKEATEGMKKEEAMTEEEATKIKTGMTIFKEETEVTEETTTAEEGITKITIRSLIMIKIIRRKPRLSFTKEGRGTLDQVTRLESMRYNR